MAYIAAKTDWTQGDGVRDVDMNRIESNIGNLQAVSTVLVPVSGWTNTIPYTQTINMSGISAVDKPTLSGGYDPNGWATATVAGIKAARKAWGYVERAVSGEGTITLYCYRGKPAVDFYLYKKGV